MSEIQQTDSMILPIYDPLIKAYFHIGMPFSVLPPRHVESGWVYQTYAQLIYHREDRKEEVVIYGYDTEKKHIFWRAEKDEVEKKSSLIELLEEYNFFAGNRRDQYLRLRPVKKQKKQGILKKFRLK